MKIQVGTLSPPVTASKKKKKDRGTGPAGCDVARQIPTAAAAAVRSGSAGSIAPCRSDAPLLTRSSRPSPLLRSLLCPSTLLRSPPFQSPPSARLVLDGEG
jgi:hypothetical protein